jgi:hypothetical protein
MPYLKPYSIPWLEFSAEKARTDVEAGKDPAAVLDSLVVDVLGFVEQNRKKIKRDIPEEVRKQRSERMKEMRARGIGGWPKNGSSAQENENDGVSDG